MTQATALVCGVLGQDGSYLAEQLLADGWRVVGGVRSGHVPDERRALAERVQLVTTDALSVSDWRRLIQRVAPAEIYNVAGRTTGSGMYDDPVGIGDANGLSVVRLLEAIRLERPQTRFCQASSSEMFGDPAEVPQSERTPLVPRSPYAAAKAYAHAMVGVYRERHALHASSAILFNHESPRRSTAFVTRKITMAAARIALGFGKTISLGDMGAQRDWGYAPDYTRAMRAMLRTDRGGDFVVATGQLHSVADVCRIAFETVGLDFRACVSGGDATLRRTEGRVLVGDASKARSMLGWAPSIGFEQMIKSMVDADLRQLADSPDSASTTHP